MLISMLILEIKSDNLLLQQHYHFGGGGGGDPLVECHGERGRCSTMCQA